MNPPRRCGSARSASSAAPLGLRPVYRDAAAALGRRLAERGLRLVYGGGRVGLMGAVADAALAAGGEVVGIIPEALATKELAHDGLSELLVVHSMNVRKARMADLADAFIALPGGYGTFEELCEIITWAQLGLHRKPVGLLNVAGYYDSLLALFDHAREERFMRPEHQALVLQDEDPEVLLERLASHRPPDMRKWINPYET